MTEGLEVTIQYRGAKYAQVATPATPSSEFAILKKDLAHLRVHSPSQKNVRRVDGSFVLHWPSAGPSFKVPGLVDSLHTRWFKLCSDDPEALKLRDFLSIASITLRQDGLLIRSTAGAKQQPSQDAPSGTLAERLAGPLPEVVQQPATAPVPSPSRPPPSIPPPRLPPSAPRLDRQPPPHLKRRMSSGEGPSNQTRQKLDVPETPTTAAPLPPTDTQPQPTQPITPSPLVDPPPGSSTPGDATGASPQPTRDDATSPTHAQTPTVPKVPETPTTPPPLQPREPGEMTPRPVRTGSGLGPGPGPRPPAPHYPPLSSTGPSPGSPFAGSNSSGNSHGGGDAWARRRDRDRDVNRLTRELWDTRRQLTAMQAREQAILDDLERLGVRPESSGGADRHGAGVGVGGSREALWRLEADVRAERAKRLRAERALSDVERECAAPFVVPALFQAFMSLSELSN